MGTFFQHIVDNHAKAEEAERLANHILDWLIQIQVIENKQSDCILGRNKAGYPPGKRYKDVVDQYPDEPDIYDLRTNGLEIVIGRSVYTPGQESSQDINCPICHSACEGDWAKAIGVWYENKGPGDIRCSKCGNTHSIIEWEFIPVWGFSDLGFTFWNWPPFKESFIHEFEEHLGHSVLYIAGKM